jgi:hypothetical protein
VYTEKNFIALADKDGINDLNDPYPKSAYHYSFSENYALRHTLNESGDTRSSSTYKITDSLGNGFGKDFIRKATTTEAIRQRGICGDDRNETEQDVKT